PIHTHPINKEPHDPPAPRDQQAADVESGEVAEPEERADEPADDCTDDAEDDGHDNPARSFAGHEKLGDSASDQAEQNPQYNAHRNSPVCGTPMPQRAQRLRVESKRRPCRSNDSLGVWVEQATESSPRPSQYPRACHPARLLTTHYSPLHHSLALSTSLAQNAAL